MTNYKLLFFSGHKISKLICKYTAQVAFTQIIVYNENMGLFNLISMLLQLIHKYILEYKKYVKYKTGI